MSLPSKPASNSASKSAANGSATKSTPTSTPHLSPNLTKVCHRIDQQTRQSSRAPNSVTLLAVSKKHPTDAISQLYNLGQRDFGENYLQEALAKIDAIEHTDIVWHFIGPIQSNKTRAIAENFNWVHTVDRLKVAQRLSDQRPNNSPNLNVCIQVNIDQQASKSGAHPKDVAALVSAVSALPHLNLRGLMIIPNPETNTDGSAFSEAKSLFDQINKNNPPPHWDTLSMGMSADLEQAIAHGSNIVRIGTDIFGPRT
ncbi:MAG: YggS family pyridoxal phosphate-dependent enzyme [Agarilytica sp.]